MQKFTLIEEDKPTKTKLIFLNPKCKKCLAQFVKFISVLRRKAKTDYAFKAVYAEEILKTAALDLQKNPYANKNLSYFYFDPKQRLSNLVGFVPEKTNAQLVVLQGTKVLTSVSVNLNDFSFIQRYQATWK